MYFGVTSSIANRRWNALFCVLSLALLRVADGLAVAAEPPGQTVIEASRATRDWGARMTPPARGERLRARDHVREALHALQSRLSERADRYMLAHLWRLDRLSEQLDADPPDRNALREIVAAQSGRRGGPLQPLLNALRRSVMVWNAGWEDSPQIWEAAARGAIVLERLQSPATGSLSASEEAEVRAAFAAVARTHRADEWLESIRLTISRPNQRFWVGGDYLRAVSRRQFRLPLRVEDVAPGIGAAGAGSLEAQTSLVLVDSDRSAAFEVCVDAVGDADWRGARRRAILEAHSDETLASRQSIEFSAAAFDIAAPRVSVRSNTSLTGFDLAVRHVIPGRPAERWTRRIVERRLPSADDQAAAMIADAVRERVDDEGHDLASRLRGMFLAAYWLPLGASDLEPRTEVSSSESGVTWDAEYAGHDQLGALSSPPDPGPDPSHPGRPAFDTWLALHMSAVNHMSARLAGARFDESMLADLLREEFKLTSDDLNRLPPRRLPAALWFSAVDLPRVSFVANQLQLVVPLSAVELDGQRFATPGLVVRTSYVLEKSKGGIRLVRESLAGLPASESAARVAQTLARFLPSELRPVARFQNAGVAQRMRLAELRLADGWLMVGTRSVREVGGNVSAGEAAAEFVPSRFAAANPVEALRDRSAGADASTSLATRLGDAQLLYCFQGKGSCLPYDAGILHESYARIPALREQRVIVAGNSSGSIPAAYFSCFGFSDASVDRAVDHLLRGDRDAVRNMENPSSKTSKLLAGRRTEIAHSVLREYVAFALGVDDWRDAATIDEIVRRSTARPRHPALIVACNKEVLENRARDDGRIPGDLKEFDLATFSVSWRPEVYAYYRQNPERFAREHPDLALGPDRRIGHAVTLFVDQSLYELLRRIPAEERMADLRLMSDASDVALAILASVSEPTYFDPVVEPRPERLLVGDTSGDLGGVKRRTYYGGYIVAMPAQDVRRMLPGIRVVGTGWRHNSLPARRLLRDWLLADVEPVAEQSEWWSDLEMNPDAEFRGHMDFRDLTASREFQFGVRRARECLDQDQGFPEFVVRPRYARAAAQALWPAGSRATWVEEGEGVPEGRALRTLRGLGPLVTRRKTEPEHKEAL